MREASYRFRATFRRRWAGYLTLVVLIGLVGGVAMAAVAGARRTQSSFPTYLASTNPSDLQMFTEFAPITGTGYSEKVNAAVARVPYVEGAVDVVGFDGNLQVMGKRASGVPGEAPPALEGSTGSAAEYFATDRVTVLQGRMANPARAEEVVMSAGAAAEFGLRLGSTLQRGLLHRRADERAELRRLPQRQAPPASSPSNSWGSSNGAPRSSRTTMPRSATGSR